MSNLLHNGAEKFEVVDLKTKVKVVYEGWLGFYIYAKDGKMKAGKPFDIRKNQALPYVPEYGPIFHEAYKLAWDILIRPYKPSKAEQLSLDIK